jgi:hypothetical protein
VFRPTSALFGGRHFSKLPKLRIFSELSKLSPGSLLIGLFVGWFVGWLVCWLVVYFQAVDLLII